MKSTENLAVCGKGERCYAFVGHARVSSGEIDDDVIAKQTRALRTKEAELSEDS